MSHILLYKSVTPATPPAGTVIIYPKADGRFYYMGEDGIEYIISSPSADTRIITGTTDTLAQSDDGKVLIYTNAAGCAITYPDGLNEKFQCSVIAAGAVAPIITPGGTDTINGAGTGVSPSAQYKALYLVKHEATNAIAVS